jgi:hypothetical protein
MGKFYTCYIQLKTGKNIGGKYDEELDEDSDIVNRKNKHISFKW